MRRFIRLRPPTVMAISAIYFILGLAILADVRNAILIAMLHMGLGIAHWMASR